jgi:hypothetical protein
MPRITIKGNSPVFGRPGQYEAAQRANAGEQPFGYPGQWENARWLNQNQDAVRRTRERNQRDEQRAAEQMERERHAAEMAEARGTMRVMRLRLRERERDQRDEQRAAEQMERERHAAEMAEARGAMRVMRLRLRERERDRREADQTEAVAYREMRSEAAAMDRQHMQRQRALLREKERDRREKDRAEAAAYRYMRSEADYMNRQHDAAAGGGRGGGYVPFLGGFGFGGVGGALGGLFVGGLLANMAGRVLEDIVFAPQKIGAAEAGALSAATPALNLKLGSYSMMRDVGGRPDALYRSLFPGGYQTPGFLASLGLGPQEALGLLQGYGIAPTSAEEAVGMMRALGSAAFMPGLGGIDVSQHMSIMGRYGLLQRGEGAAGDTGTIRGQVDILGNVMENAIARGMNRTEVLRSIDAAVSATARSGAGAVNMPGLADWLYSFAALPGGRTGEVGLQAAAGVASAVGQVGSDPLRTMMFAQATMRRLGSRGALQDFLDRAQPGYFAQFTSNEPGAQAVENYLTAQRRGDYYGASLWLAQIVQGNPQAATQLFSESPFLQGVPSYMRPYAAAQAANMSPMAFLATTLYRPGGAYSTSGSQLPTDMAVGGFNEGKVAEYRNALLRQGVNPNLVETVINASRANRIDPVAYGALLMTESSGGSDPNKSYGPQGIGAYGMTGIQNPAQISGSSGMPMPITPEMSIIEGAQLFASGLRGGSLRGAVSGYVGPQFNETYWQRYMRAYAVGGGSGGAGVPGLDIEARASAEQGMMAASATSLAELGTIVPKLNHALEVSIDALARLAKAAAQAAGRMETTVPGGSMRGIMAVP